MHVRPVGQLDAAYHQVHAAGGAGPGHPVELAPLVPGEFVAAEQHRDPPRLGAPAGRRGQLAQRGVLAGQHRLVDPADLVDEVVEEPRQATRPDEGEQPGGGERGEACQPATEVLRVVADQPERAGIGPAQRPEQQRGDHRVAATPVAPGKVYVADVEQRHQRRYGHTAVDPYGADPQRSRCLAPDHRGRLPAGPVRTGGTGRLAGGGLGGPGGEPADLRRVPVGEFHHPAVPFRTDPAGYPGGGVPDPAQPVLCAAEFGPRRRQPGPGRAQGVRQHGADPVDELGP
ncbi:hypothetical protein GCM10027615_52560 [Plantactinospora veratri]